MNCDPPTISYHRIMLRELNNKGDALAEFTLHLEDGAQQTRLLPVPAGLPGEEVTIDYNCPLWFQPQD